MQLLNEISNRQRYRTYVRLVVIGLAAFAAYLFSVLIQESHYWWALIPTFALACLSAVEFAVADLLLDRRFPPESTEFLERLQRKLRTTTVHGGIVDALNSCVETFRGCDPSRISSTVHLRIDVLSDYESDTLPALIQISDYTRAGLGGRRWRLLEPTKGLVGRCLRVGERVCVNFRSQSEYRARMVMEFGYTAEEVDRHTTSARSHMAHPLMVSGDIVGVLYFFSTEPQVFPLAASPEHVCKAGNTVLSLLQAAEIL
jgi:hypothetical protein